MATNETWIYEIERPDSVLLKLYVMQALCTGPFFPITFLPLYFKYATLKYRFDEQGVLMSWGILWRREIFLTYARIQDIHLSRGIIERWLKIATINIQTASGSSMAEMSIVGFTQYENIRDFLYSKMRGARFDEGDESEEGAQPAGDDEALQLLREMAAETRRVRVAIEKQLGVSSHDEEDQP